MLSMALGLGKNVPSAITLGPELCENGTAGTGWTYEAGEDPNPTWWAIGSGPENGVYVKPHDDGLQFHGTSTDVIGIGKYGLVADGKDYRMVVCASGISIPTTFWTHVINQAVDIENGMNVYYMTATSVNFTFLTVSGGTSGRDFILNSISVREVL